MFACPAGSSTLRDLAYVNTYERESTFDSLYAHSFSGVSFGTEAPDRDVVIVISGRCYQNSIVAVTIGGIAATVLANKIDYSGMFQAICHARVPTGTSGTVLVEGATGGDREWLAIHLHVYAAYGLSEILVSDFQTGGGSYTGPYWNSLITRPNARHIAADVCEKYTTPVSINYDSAFMTANSAQSTIFTRSGDSTRAVASATALIKSNELTKSIHTGADGDGHITYSASVYAYGTAIYSLV